MIPPSPPSSSDINVASEANCTVATKTTSWRDTKISLLSVELKELGAYLLPCCFLLYEPFLEKILIDSTLLEIMPLRSTHRLEVSLVVRACVII